MRAVDLAESQRWALRIGRRLRVIRCSLDVAASELAAALSVNERTIYRWERGAMRMPLRRVHQAAAALGIPVSDMLEDE